MRLRIRSSTGAETLTLDPGTTLGALKVQIGATSIRAGYPPREITAPDSQKVSALFREGDMVVVSNSAGAPSTAAAKPQMSRMDRRFRVRVVPDDNSCLFRSVNALLSRPNTPSSISALRAEVSAVVSSNPMLYSKDFLGRPNADYCAWIMSDDAWGGAIELGILASRFAVELGAFDIKTMRLDRYGEGNGYPKIGFLLYDGIHYNYVAEENRGGDAVLFDVNDQSVIQHVHRLAKQDHDNKKYTDTTNFTLRCAVCNKRFKGEKEAVQHAQSTGHQEFDEK